MTLVAGPPLIWNNLSLWFLCQGQLHIFIETKQLTARILQLKVKKKYLCVGPYEKSQEILLMYASRLYRTEQ